MKLIDIHICYKDRPSELGLLLQSLRTQTYQNFRVLISDDVSGTRIESYHFLNCILNKMREDGHEVIINVNPFQLGVSKNRQKLVDMSLKDDVAEYVCRLDDDVIIQSDYLERLVNVIEKHGADLATGITPFMGQPQFKRDSQCLGVIDRIVFNEDGSLKMNLDDCGCDFIDENVLICDHFRSCALYKLDIHKQGITYDGPLSNHGFREESILSFKMIIAGYVLKCDVQAKANHLICQSGGERFANQNELVKFNQEMFEKWTKEQYQKHGDFIMAYHKKLGIDLLEPTEEELAISTNLIFK